MSRSVALVLAWLVAAGGALGVAWQGVAVVGEQVTDDRPAPLTAEEVRAAEDAPGGVPGDAASTTTVPTTGDRTSTTSTTAPTRGGQPAAEIRPYNLVGGSLALRFEPSGVTVVWATPNSGFEVETEPEHGNGVKVEFESESHDSRVDGWWEGGPMERIREEPDG